MAQVLALEWDASEARLVVASSRGERVVIEEAFSVALRPEPSQPDEAKADLGGSVAAALAARGISRVDTLVAVGRANVELRQLSLPAAPEEEMPELVRFQAMREFNEFDEDWLLDFVPIDLPSVGHPGAPPKAHEGEPRSVLAAAIGPETVEQIRKACAPAGLNVTKMILRPCAAASLLGRARPSGGARPASPRRDAGPTPLRLIVDLLPGEADLTAIIQRNVVFLRTCRLGGDPLEDTGHARALLGELRRTVAAAENQLGGRRVESIVLCGSGDSHAALAKLIEGELATPVELFDPFAGLTLSRPLRDALPENPGRFAPLLGMALAELERTGHAIDFLHPRRRAEPPSRRTKLVLAGVAVALLVVAFFGLRAWQRRSLTAEIKQLTNRSGSLEREVAAAKKALTAVEVIEKWTADDVVWLDELRRLSDDFPPAKEVMLTELTLGAGAQGGKMTLQGLAASAGAISRMEDRLRNPSRRVEDHGSSDDDSSRFYSRGFSTLVYVGPEEQ